MAPLWSAIVPFKGSVAAKSRLHALYGVDGEDWARAFFSDILDVLETMPEIGKIVVVTSDAQVGNERPGIQVIADTGGGLNDAILLGARSCSGKTIVIPADLATLDPTDLSSFLDEASSIPFGFVRDAAGEGTSLLFVHLASELTPHFGSDSATTHLKSGAVEVHAPLTLRLDVDDAISLLAASGRLGVHAKRLLALAKNFPSNE
ncbi:unannotated protein [freshwater metagenome]|uniref:Unannotated protein n=1 Tax=freshwater metagenome TaxID=449393 RepID=A0A6J6QLU2_9ZZZZ|nr:2-phospho-L-lactate guanylyltransferase [Actinomycetota bacterium]MTB14724.1 2-phospho-L-lactate guanylyltransferase [Actinomycetota bacterium]MTB25906.1 2-phospho-L-lactate guanylyltransferase [Actinomycetota bacterium]